MPGPILHLGASVQCGHGGQAVPMSTAPRVLVSGQPVATMTVPYSVAGCPFTSAPGPCVSAKWITGSLRVRAMAQPVAIQTGAAICAPNGAPLLVTAAQPRAIAT